MSKRSTDHATFVIERSLARAGVRRLGGAQGQGDSVGREAL
jgi:hypothetical protein